MGKVFNKGLDESDKKEGFLKRLKNNEGKKKEQLNATEDQKDILEIIGENKKIIVYLKEVINKLFEKYFKSFTKSVLMINAAKMIKEIDYNKFKFSFW